MPRKPSARRSTRRCAQEMRRDPQRDRDRGGRRRRRRHRRPDDAYGGVLGVTKGLFAEFGEARVLDTPITEIAFIGAATGAAVPACGRWPN